MRRATAATAACALALPGLLATTASAGPATTVAPESVQPGTYLVLMRAEPLATYDGHIDGLAATAAAPGERLRANSPAGRAYAEHLAHGQSRLLSTLGSPRVLYSYTAAVDGFAAVLTSAQVKQAQATRGVVGVERSSLARLDRVDAGAASSGVAGMHLAGTLRDAARAGRGVVVGVVDSGVWPENPSFASFPLDRAALRREYPGFTGSCAAGERWSRGLCNTKVVAAQYFLKDFGRGNVAVADYTSPRDGSGHGSHTAASAAGNAGVDVTIEGQNFGRISGAAPGAALAIYKACWTAPDPRADGCATADTVAAIDRAVGDGVDVISYSIGDAGASSTPGAVALAFRNAAQSGVFVATSAGDAGPAPATVAHTSPWVTTVAATTGQQFTGDVVLGDGRRYGGSMVSDRRVGPARLVDGADVPAKQTSAHDAALCFPGALDASAVDGAIVVCQRGATSRVSKSASVERAGGIAMVLANSAPGGTNDDVHSVPTVQVSQHVGLAIRGYITASARPTASLDPSASSSDSTPRVAGFSSRGPDPHSDGEVLKPDVAAPGVGVVSAVAPPSNFGRLWDLASGTSMAVPQVAGLGADIMAAHPDWSPAAVKSALMTTATPLASSGGPLAVGAGEVNPRRALDPGLVYEQSIDWANLASVAVGDLVAERTVTRRVTNVGRAAETYTAHVVGVAGVAVSVDPARVTLAPGQSATFSMTFTARRGAHYGQFVAGSLTWAGSRGHRVTTPIAVRTSYVGAPAEVGWSGRDGTGLVTARAGVTGTLATTLVGPVAARPETLSLTPGVFDGDDPTRTPQAWMRAYSVPRATAALRFEVASAGGDVDLYVYRDGLLVASSVSLSSTERLTLDGPAAGRYSVYVVAAPSAAGAVSNASSAPRPVPAAFTGWVLPRAARNPHVTAPRGSDVTGGRAFSVEVGWSGLSTSRRWFGELGYAHSDAHTYISVN